MKNADLPAMPHLVDLHTFREFGGSNLVSDLEAYSSGLTKREHFAAMAMQGLLASDTDLDYADFASSSVEMADALLAELERTK